MYLLSFFQNGDDDPTRYYFTKYYMPFAEVKDCDALIDNKPFSDQPVKKEEAHQKLELWLYNKKCIRWFL